MHLNTEIVLRQKMALRSKGIKSEIILEGIVFKSGVDTGPFEVDLQVA